MSHPPPSVDETILSLLRARHVLASADLAGALGIPDGSVRRHLRRLIRGGYVFAPEHGRYRITAAGAAAIAPLSDNGRTVEGEPAIRPLPAGHSAVNTPAPTSPVDDTLGRVYARMRRRR